MQQQAAESTKSDLAGRGDIRERRVADDAGEDLADVCRSVVRSGEERKEGLRPVKGWL